MPQAKWPRINGRFMLPTEIANPLCLAYAMLRHSSASRFFWQKRPTVEVKAFFIIPSFLKSWVFVRLRVMDKLTLFFSVTGSLHSLATSFWKWRGRQWISIAYQTSRDSGDYEDICFMFGYEKFRYGYMKLRRDYDQNNAGHWSPLGLLWRRPWILHVCLLAGQ